MRLRYLFLALALLLSACGKGPESTVEAFYQALGRGEIDTARGYFSQQLIAMMGEAKLNASLTKQATQIAECGGLKQVSVTLQGEGELRVGNANLQFAGNCPSRDSKVLLIKEDGAWKLTLK